MTTLNHQKSMRAFLRAFLALKFGRLINFRTFALSTKKDGICALTW